jgi:hypothetical protein
MAALSAWTAAPSQGRPAAGTSYATWGRASARRARCSGRHGTRRRQKKVPWELFYRKGLDIMHLRLNRTTMLEEGQLPPKPPGGGGSRQLYSAAFAHCGEKHEAVGALLRDANANDWRKAMDEEMAGLAQ